MGQVNMNYATYSPDGHINSIQNKRQELRTFQTRNMPLVFNNHHRSMNQLIESSTLIPIPLFIGSVIFLEYVLPNNIVDVWRHPFTSSKKSSAL